MLWKAAPGQQGVRGMGKAMAEGGAQGRAVGLTAVVAAVAGAVIWWATGQGAKAPATSDAVPTVAAPAAAPSESPTDAPMVTPAPPRFDVVRVDGAGLATIAGTAPPEAMVSIRLDGVELATAKADATGQFATILTLPPSELPRLLGLVAVLADGTEVAGVETVAIGPVAASALAAAEAPASQTSPPPLSPPPALLLSEVGAVVLQAPVAPDQPSPLPEEVLSIDGISYGTEGQVLLSGRANPGAALRLYLDDAPLAEAQASSAGRWQASLPDVAPGLHRLRADSLDPAGKVLARFETPFQREAPEALAPEALAPKALAPAVPEAAASDPAPVAAPAPITITVQPGLTLWAIARENFGDGVMYVQVFEANRDKIKDPDLIYPGQVFTVPKP